MYNILKDNVIIETQSELVYVKDQPNKVIITCSQEEGQGILSKDQSTIYSIVGMPQLRDYEFVTVVEITEVDKLKENVSIVEGAVMELAENQSKGYENQEILENAILELAELIGGM